MIKEFEAIRDWSSIRGIGGKDAQVQFQRCMQELTEIHDAMCNNDFTEMKDAVGDTIVTLINLAKILGFNAEDGLEQAFNVIELRKGIRTERGDFVRYRKLDMQDRQWCDRLQGSPASEYFDKSMLDHLGPEDFMK